MLSTAYDCSLNFLQLMVSRRYTYSDINAWRLVGMFHMVL
jgi:hypothetical protein